MAKLLVSPMIALILAVSPFALLAPKPPPDVVMTPLLVEICGHETQAHPRAGFAVNKSGSAWGECQVKYWSAVAFGGFDDVMLATGRPSRDPGELFELEVNRRTAGNILALCRKLYGKHARRVIYCYGAGPHSTAYTNHEHRLFSRQIATDFAESRRRIAFQSLRE